MTLKNKAINYPLASNSWGLGEHAAILKVMASNRYTMGPEVAAFEEEFAAKMGVKHAIMTNSGSSANLVGLTAWMRARNIPVGSEIIVPAVSWSTTYFPLQQLGMIPVFVDINQWTLGINPVHAANAITDKTAAIFAVNLLGMPAHLSILKGICNTNKIDLLEDNCESLGATEGSGRYAGTFGVFGTYSFFFSHHMQTMEGGMITTDHQDIAEYCRAIRAHGWIRDLKTDLIFDRDTYNPWESNFKFIVPGYCVRPVEMSGAIGRVQLKKLDDMIFKRRRNAKVFTEEFSGLVDIQHEGGLQRSSWFGFACTIKERDRGSGFGTKIRNMLVNQLAELGVQTRPIVTGNFLNQPCMKYIPHRVYGTFQNAENLDRYGFFFGNDQRDLRPKIREVAKVVRGILR